MKVGLAALLCTAILCTLLISASAQQQGNEDEVAILCDGPQDCMGKNAHCSNGQCTCSWGFTMRHGDCFLEAEYPDEELVRNKRSPDSKVEKLEKKLLKAQIKEAKKKGAVVHAVPVVHHVPVVHAVPVVHTAPVYKISRHRRSPSPLSKIEKKIIKSQVKRQGKKEAKKLLRTRTRRDSHKKIEKLERKLVKEQIKQAKKDAKKGRIAYAVAQPSHHYGWAPHAQPVYTQTYSKSKSHSGPLGAVSRTVAKAKSYLG